jgi:hypothetical protein
MVVAQTRAALAVVEEQATLAPHHLHLHLEGGRGVRDVDPTIRYGNTVTDYGPYSLHAMYDILVEDTQSIPDGEEFGWDDVA